MLEKTFSNKTQSCRDGFAIFLVSQLLVMLFWKYYENLSYIKFNTCRIFRNLTSNSIKP